MSTPYNEEMPAQMAAPDEAKDNDKVASGEVSDQKPNPVHPEADADNDSVREVKGTLPPA